MAGVHNVVHLQVDGGVHDRHDQTLFERQTRGVHELQQDGEALGVHLRVQTDGVKVALVGVGKECVEEPTGGHRKEKQKHTQKVNYLNLSGGSKKKWERWRWRRPYLQAMRTVLCARNCCLFTKIVTSVRMSLLRNRFRLSRTSLAWRVNCMQLSAAQAIFSKSANTRQTQVAALKVWIFLKKHIFFLHFVSLISLTLLLCFYVEALDVYISHCRCFSRGRRHLLNKHCLDF